MHANSLSGVPEIFQKLTDPRDPRGVRFPYHALCALVFLGLLARINEMAVLIRWAKAHWEQLREPLGFTRPEATVPPAQQHVRPVFHGRWRNFRSPGEQCDQPHFAASSPNGCSRSSHSRGNFSRPPLTAKPVARVTMSKAIPKSCSMFLQAQNAEIRAQS